MELVSLSAVSLESLEQELGVAGLRAYLDAVKVPVVTDNGRDLVLDGAWRRHLGELVRRDMAVLHRANGSQWDERRLRLLSRNPAVGPLIEDFLAYVDQHYPELVAQRNAYTITLKLPTGGWAGLKPRAWG